MVFTLIKMDTITRQPWFLIICGRGKYFPVVFYSE